MPSASSRHELLIVHSLAFFPMMFPPGPKIKVDKVGPITFHFLPGVTTSPSSRFSIEWWAVSAFIIGTSVGTSAGLGLVKIGLGLLEKVLDNWLVKPKQSSKDSPPA